MRSPENRCRRYACLIGAIFALGLGLAAPAGAAEKGVVPDLTWGTSRAEMDRTIALMSEAGVRWVRANIGWSAVEPDGPGVYNEGWLAEIDYAVGVARRAGMEVLMPISDGVPYWASADPAKFADGGGKHWNVYYRPANTADYGRFVRFVVDRYKLQGVQAYEIWNEPNHPRFWPSGPNPAEYLPLLKAGHEAVKAGDPSATVVLGGLSRSDYSYVEKLYELGAKPYFDVLAVHPYTTADPTSCWTSGALPSMDAFCAIEQVRKTMVAHGDGEKEIWLTEYGWSSSPLAPWSVDEATQATYVAKALEKIDSYPYVGKSFYYGFRNVYWLDDNLTDWEANLGLLRTDFSPKPAYAAFRAYRPAAPAPAPAPSDPPKKKKTGRPASRSTSATQPAPSAVPTRRPARPAVSLRLVIHGAPNSSVHTLRLRAAIGAQAAATPSRRLATTARRRIVRVDFQLDGRSMGSDRSAPFAVTWKVPGALARARHSARAVAYDASGRPVARAIAVFHRTSLDAGQGTRRGVHARHVLS